MSINTDPKTGTATVHCDDCGVTALIFAMPDVDPLVLLESRVQGWRVRETEQKCPKCRAIAK